MHDHDDFGEGEEQNQEDKGGHMEPDLCFWNNQTQLGCWKLNMEFQQKQQEQHHQLLPAVFDQVKQQSWNMSST